MCHVTKYSTIRGVFQQPWPGVSPTAILNEEKALGTRLIKLCTGKGFKVRQNLCQVDHHQRNVLLISTKGEGTGGGGEGVGGN